MSLETEKIIELLKKVQPDATQEELEKMGENLYELARFLVHLRVKKSEEVDELELLKKEAPP